MKSSSLAVFICKLLSDKEVTQVTHYPMKIGEAKDERTKANLDSEDRMRTSWGELFGAIGDASDAVTQEFTFFL